LPVDEAGEGDWPSNIAGKQVTVKTMVIARSQAFLRGLCVLVLVGFVLSLFT
jgi:hypothetical protein